MREAADMIEELFEQIRALERPADAGPIEDYLSLAQSSISLARGLATAI